MTTNATTRRQGSGDDEQVVVSNGRAEVSWKLGAELTLFEHMGMRARIAGGPLIELLDASHGRRAFTVGMGRDEERSFAQDPVPITTTLGSGLLARRRFPVAGQRLAAELDIAVYHTQPWITLTLRVANNGPAPVIVNRLFPFVAGRAWGDHPLYLGGRESGFAVYKQGWQSWSHTSGVSPETPDARPRLHSTLLWHTPAAAGPREPLGGDVDVVSEGMVCVGHPAEHTALLAGFLDAERYFGQLYVDRRNGSLTTATLVDGRELMPGESIETEPLMLALGTPDALLDSYAAAVGQYRVARPSTGSLTGWCSWYQYYTGVTEADVMENVAALRMARVTTPLEVVQIDDGYQRAVGDWTTPHEKFPSGMGVVASRIREAGFRPGLWIAPFTVAANSKLAHEHPEWLIQDDQGHPQEAGNNWQTTLYGLDTTHPGAQEWLRRLFSTLVDQWGYDYLKLDFLVTGAIEGHRWVRSTTRAAALRQGLELIRSVVGPDVYLLGCGCPLLSAVGVVDGMRIGPDVAPRWSIISGLATLTPGDAYPLPGAEGAIRNTLMRAWMHPRLWTNDGDCLLARETDTDLQPDEVRALATAIGLTGGMVLISDAVAHLPLGRLDLIARLLPPLPERALPLSYFEDGIPERVITKIERPWGSWWLVGLFNTARTAREMRVTWNALGLEPGRYHASEFWTGSYLGISADGAAVPVGAHGAAVLAVRRESEEPLLLSTSFHLAQGAQEIASWDFERESGRLRWVVAMNRYAAGTFAIWIPSDLVPRRLISTARSATWRRHDSGHIVVDAEIAERAEFALELEQSY
jgi:alpha-galactosidase